MEKKEKEKRSSKVEKRNNRTYTNTNTQRTKWIKQTNEKGREIKNEMSTEDMLCKRERR